MTDLSSEQTDLQALATLQKDFEQLRNEIGKVIVGQDPIVRALFAAVFSGGHVLLIGVPGLAKTLLVRTLADVMSWSFSRIQFTPDLMPSDITGVELLQVDQEGRRHMEYIPGPVFANLVLADEINRTPPKTQSALLEAMQEHHVTSMGKTHPLPDPFLVVATQNPIEQEGTYPLPEAQLDRFMFSLWMEYPSEDEEADIVETTTRPRSLKLEKLLHPEQIAAYQNLVSRIPVSSHVIRYAVALARNSRPGASNVDAINTYVEWGAGPRSAQHMILAAKALAAMEGEPTVCCAHVRTAAPWVLRHRVIPNFQAAGEGLDAKDLITKLIEAVPETQG